MAMIHHEEHESGFAVVILKQPLPNVRHTVFVFYSEMEAEEFASCIHSQHPSAETETHITTGLPTAIFPDWSF